MNEDEKKELELLRSQKQKQAEYRRRYNQEKYDRLNLLLPKGIKADLEKVAALTGYKSITAYIVDTVKQDLENIEEMEQQKTAPAAPPTPPTGYYPGGGYYPGSYGGEELPFT